MKIFLFTSVYPASFSPKGTTPVVHYFAKEWVSNGHKVHVFHISSSFPRIYYALGGVFKRYLDSKLGHLIPKNRPYEYDEEIDGVGISHLQISKYKPYGRFPKEKINSLFHRICSFIEVNGVPDCFVGHWDNPQLEILYLLKNRFQRPTSLVFHNNRFDKVIRCYGNDFHKLVDSLDLVGFRNQASQESFYRSYGRPRHSFIAASGVSTPFLEAGNSIKKEIVDVRKFIYVGTLISRKYPVSIITALSMVFHDDPFCMTYVGEGENKRLIEQEFRNLNCNGNLCFTGRIPREEVIKYLIASDVFVMISKGEIFGLVYLEAMALGCITIASRNEGVDGIIEDGINGFLCEAGNASELASIINRIRNLPKEELAKISRNAQKTANAYSDKRVAEYYLSAIKLMEE